MRRALFALPLLFVLSWSATAEASPIVVNAGQTLTFNFDFFAAGAIPPPPYPFVTFNTGLVVASLDGGDAGGWNGYDGLHATGGNIFLSPFLNLISTSDNSPGRIDGIFSFVIAVTAGSITIDPSAFGGAQLDQNLTGNIAPFISSVPEPATLTLLGGGLAAAVLRRRRRVAR